jgi:hypothetical protein
LHRCRQPLAQIDVLGLDTDHTHLDWQCSAKLKDGQNLPEIDFVG